MKEFLLLGSALGAVFGLLHGGQLYRQMILRHAGMARAAYFAVWTFGLWTVLGAYLLAFWVLGTFGLAAQRLTDHEDAKRDRREHQ